jgi:alkylresorcinol/alkylpyrone synthase
MLLAVELCSLTVQRDDTSAANVVSTGLFGDGAAAVLLVGAEHPLAHDRRPRVIDSRSIFFPDTERVMGWDFVDSGFKVVLSPEVPRIVRDELPAAVKAFLASHELGLADIATWVAHPGGPKVLDALEEGLGLDRGELDVSREVLALHGNLSSASVLFVLEEARRRAPAPGSYGLLMAMGPAFAAELVLLRW